MKPLRFLGDTREQLREISTDAKQDAGYQLDKCKEVKCLMITNRCHLLVGALKKYGYGMKQGLIELYKQLDLWMQFMCCMFLRKKHRQLQNEISILQRLVLTN